jgi:hypothetical protein
VPVGHVCSGVERMCLVEDVCCEAPQERGSHRSVGYDLLEVLQKDTVDFGEMCAVFEKLDTLCRGKNSKEENAEILDLVNTIVSEVSGASPGARGVAKMVSIALRGKMSYPKVMCYFYMLMRYEGARPAREIDAEFERNGRDIALLINQAEYESEIMVLDGVTVWAAACEVSDKFPESLDDTPRQGMMDLLMYVKDRVYSLRPYATELLLVCVVFVHLSIEGARVFAASAERYLRDINPRLHLYLQQKTGQVSAETLLLERESLIRITTYCTLCMPPYFLAPVADKINEYICSNATKTHVQKNKEEIKQ